VPVPTAHPEKGPVWSPGGGGAAATCWAAAHATPALMWLSGTC